MSTSACALIDQTMLCESEARSLKPEVPVFE
jgi:hypothetical protein